MQGILLFDADNTLWDTDSVFRQAQVAMLRVLARIQITEEPELQLSRLRAMDDELVAHFGTHEYDFRVLATALAYHYTLGYSAAESAHMVLSSPSGLNPELAPIVEEASRAFADGLQQIPPLYADTMPVLSSIRLSVSAHDRIVTIMLSEGDINRLERTLAAYQVRERGLFDEIILCRKSVAVIRQAEQAGRSLLPTVSPDVANIGMLIGDSLQRDIKFGNQAKLITVYKPSSYRGDETPGDPSEQPSYSIERLAQLLPILAELGLSVVL